MEQKEVEILLKKRLIDLSRMANRRDIVTFSNFLNLNEINLFHQIIPELESRYEISGGYEFAERQMIAFIPDALYYEWEYPIVCLKYHPAYPKFADELTHRDILGALMSLGIERSRIGDIKIDGLNYYIFCEESMSAYLLQEISSIRHTVVVGEIVNPADFHITQEFEEMTGIVSSPRLDNMVAFVTGRSRSQSVLMIQGQKVFVNQKLISSNAYDCKPNDVISIRGYGKFVYEGSSGETKKGRQKITVKKYI